MTMPDTPQGPGTPPPYNSDAAGCALWWWIVIIIIIALIIWWAFAWWGPGYRRPATPPTTRPQAGMVHVHAPPTADTENLG